MSTHSNRPGAGSSGPTCLDCAGTHRHADTCRQTIDADALLRADRAEMAAGRTSRPVHRVEVAAFEAATGHRPTRLERRRWRVRLSVIPGGVRRVVCDGGRMVFELADEPADLVAVAR